ncbi:MAG: hypothetical protein M1391_14625 [Bacteroidetes bacterium]|nr:hypothetical protein [Bacteroidota bacterium]
MKKRRYIFQNSSAKVSLWAADLEDAKAQLMEFEPIEYSHYKFIGIKETADLTIKEV